MGKKFGAQPDGRIKLPFPPSANTSKMPRHGRLISTPELREYKMICSMLLAGHEKMPPGRYGCCVEFQAADRRRRDIANFEKHAIDAVVKAGIIKDDCLIDDLRLIRLEPDKNDPAVFIRLWAIDHAKEKK